MTKKRSLTYNIKTALRLVNNCRYYIPCRRENKLFCLIGRWAGVVNVLSQCSQCWIKYHRKMYVLGSHVSSQLTLTKYEAEHSREAPIGVTAQETAAFYGTRRLITRLTRALNVSLF